MSLTEQESNMPSFALPSPFDVRVHGLVHVSGRVQNHRTPRRVLLGAIFVPLHFLLALDQERLHDLLSLADIATELHTHRKCRRSIYQI